MIRGVCPCCGTKGDVALFVASADERAALAQALALPDQLAGRVLDYLRLFAPANKALASTKLRRLLTELRDLIAAAEVTRHGVTRAAPLALWRDGLDAVLASPPERLPLESHRYLIAVVARLSDTAAGRAERAQEEAQRHRGALASGQSVAVVNGPQPVGRVVDRAAGRAGAASLREALGGKPVTE